MSKQDMEYYVIEEGTFSQGIEHYNNKRYLDAIDCFYEVLQDKNKYTLPSWMNLAKIHLEMNNTEDAIYPMRKVLTYQGEITQQSYIDTYKECYIKFKSLMSSEKGYNIKENWNVIKIAEMRLESFLNKRNYKL